MEPPKYFIVALGYLDFDRAIRTNELPPGRSFQCLTEAEARRVVARNARYGIPAIVLRTDAWTEAHAAIAPAPEGVKT